jgi:hypothetical protein
MSINNSDCKKIIQKLFALFFKQVSNLSDFNNFNIGDDYKYVQEGNFDSTLNEQTKYHIILCILSNLYF